MEYRTFGKTGWQVSEIGLGGSWFYGRPEMGLKPISHGVSVIERALELGVNYFDTAPLYGRGRSEEVVGAALSGVTEPYYLATKVGYFPEPFDYTRDAILRGLDASLKRLKRDRVNLIQVHEAEKAGWEGLFGQGRTIETLLDLQSQGICDFIGLTGSDLGLMTRTLQETDAFASVITFCKYDLLTQEATEELVPTAADKNVAVICASPLHAGLLGSKHAHWKDLGRFQDLYGRLDSVTHLLEGEPEKITRLALRYLLSDNRVKMLLSGVSDIAELEDCVAVSDGQYLSEELIAKIEGL
jgi:aryl-alcohol dehydrogenase-like predicted oxidoreductase